MLCMVCNGNAGAVSGAAFEVFLSLCRLIVSSTWVLRADLANATTTTMMMMMIMIEMIYCDHEL